MSGNCCSSGIEERLVCSPPAHDDPHRCATGWTRGTTGSRCLDRRRLESHGVLHQEPPPQGGSRDGTAGVHTAAVSALPTALGQDMLEEPADTLDGMRIPRESWLLATLCDDVEMGHPPSS